MEWEPLASISTDSLSEREEMIMDHEINQYMQWEEEYNEYLNDLEDYENLYYLNYLVENYKGGNNMKYWTNWQEVPKKFYLQIFKLVVYQIKMKIFPSVKELEKDNAYYNYLLFLANALYGN